MGGPFGYGDYFLAANVYMWWGRKTEFHCVPANGQHRDFDLLTDANRFTVFSR
jgi:hypothetical protein